MAAETYNIDPELLTEFLDEAADTLAPLEGLLIELEADPGDIDIVNKIFRPVHSLKGNASFFGMMRIKELSHKMENLLDLVRNDKLAASREVVNALLPGVDTIRGILQRMRTGAPESVDEEEFKGVMEAVERAGGAGEADITSILRQVSDILAAVKFNLPADKLHTVDELLKTISRFSPSERKGGGVGGTGGGGTGGDAKPPQPLSVIYHTLREPFDKFLDEDKSTLVLESLRALETMAASDETMAIVRDALDGYETFVSKIGFDPLLRELILEKAEKLKLAGVWAARESAPPPDAAPQTPASQSDAKPAAPRGQPHADAEKTMRVSERRIDAFLSYVGELVVVEEMFNVLQLRLSETTGTGGISHEFKRVIETFSVLSDDLRQSILAVRKVPVKNILQKAPRIIRDIAAKTGKEVDVVIEGEEINIDKSYIDILDAPLTHMARNAIDHGIEHPADRVALGKPPAGSITVAVRELENEIELKLTDDGKGINFEGLKRKALELGLIQDGQSLDQRAVVDLMFQAGVSTAKEVTDVSGRGVGMDVVKRNIDSCGGSIVIDSQEGKGSTFRILLPKSVSTQIMDGFLVQSAATTYALPLDAVSECFSPPDADIVSVAGKPEMVRRRGDLFPVIQLRKTLDGKNNFARTGGVHLMVALSVDGGIKALRVDAIIGMRKVVVKDVKGIVFEDDIYKGSAIMGDGSVAMIIDVAKLAKRR